MAPVLSVGELLWDLLPAGAVLGGAPANLAYRVAALGMSARLVSRVGCDRWGERALQELRERDLDVSLLQQDAGRPTGSVRVTFDENGGHAFEIVPDVAYDFIEAQPAALEAAAGASAICFGTLIQRSPASRATLAALLDASRAAWVLCDVNLRPGCYCDETLRWSTARANVVKLNGDEIPDLADLLPAAPRAPRDFVRAAVATWSLRACVVTLAERGAVAADDSGSVVYEPGYRVSVGDTIGSGDAFTAAFLLGLMRGMPLGSAVQRGNALGALVATQRGAMHAVATEEIDALVSASSLRVVDPGVAGSC
jgi:fructokinase